MVFHCKWLTPSGDESEASLDGRKYVEVELALLPEDVSLKDVDPERIFSGQKFRHETEPGQYFGGNLFWRETIKLGKYFGGNLSWRKFILLGKHFGGNLFLLESILVGIYFGWNLFWLEFILAGKYFGGNLIWRKTIW